MMLVSYTKPSPNDSPLVELDNELSAILIDYKLPFKEKIKMYEQTLTKFDSINNSRQPIQDEIKMRAASTNLYNCNASNSE
jgi:hypothetical protein